MRSLYIFTYLTTCRNRILENFTASLYNRDFGFYDAVLSIFLANLRQ